VAELGGVGMGVATIDLRPTPTSVGDGPKDCVVTVAHRTATCTCTWSGRRRVALFLARHDAWMHAASNGCQPGVPFVTAR
jgi:hypothetical protein